MTGFDLKDYLKLLVIAALLLMLYPLFAHPMPRYLPTPDASAHYNWAFFISKDIAGLGLTLYPKLFHVTAALITNVIGLDIGTSICLIIVASSMLLVYSTYRLALLLTKNQEVSLLSSFFSLIVVVYIPGNFGVTMPIPQSVALALLPLVLYLFISKKSVLSGITLAMYTFLHASWPVALFLIVVYSFMTLREEKKISSLKPLFITLTVTFILYLPYSMYMNSHLIYLTTDPAGTSAGISLISFVWLVWPPGIFLLALYSCWKILLKKRDYTKDYRFIVLSFLIILLSTQVYLFGLTGPLVKVLFAENITIVPERFFTFSLFFMSVLSAYAVIHMTQGKKNSVVAVCLIALMVSVPYYWNKCSILAVRFSDSDIDVIKAFHNTSPFNRFGSYNNLYPGKPIGVLIAMGGQNDVGGEDAFFILNEFKTFNNINVTFFLDKRDDPVTKEFIEKHRNSMKEIYSNSDYVIYEFTEKIENSNKSLVDYLTQYSWHYNTYVYPKYTSKIFEAPAKIKVKNQDTGEEVCVRLNGSMEITQCAGGYDLMMEGSSEAFNYLFLSSYGIIPFMRGSLYLYNHNHISIKPGDDTNIRLVLPNKFNRQIDFTLFLYDVALYLNVESNNSQMKVKLARTSHGPFYKISLRFFARSIEWVNPTMKYSYTIPNILIGVPYAGIMEVYEQMRS